MDSGLHVWDQCVLCGEATLVEKPDPALLAVGLPRFNVRAYARAMTLWANKQEYDQRMLLTLALYGPEYARSVREAMLHQPELVE